MSSEIWHGFEAFWSAKSAVLEQLLHLYGGPVGGEYLAWSDPK